MTTISVSFDKNFEIHQAVASEKQGRFALTCVYVDPKGYLVASDGNMLAIIPYAIEYAPDDWKGGLIPGSFLANARKLIKTNRRMSEVVLAIDLDTNSIIQIGADNPETARFCTNLSFPQWRDCVPDSQDFSDAYPTTPTYNPSLAVRLLKAIGKPEGGYIRLNKGTGPHLFIGHNGAIGLLMPYTLPAVDWQEQLAGVKA